jgi:glyoxylase-like metal-dependent hydrolase (beta-lactamase superfamily II)
MVLGAALSTIESPEPSMLEIRPIPAFEDNYIWLLTEAPGTAVVVDPGDADPVLSAFVRRAASSPPS